MSLKSTKEYTAQDKMRDLVDDNRLLLLVLGRFGIALGFGEATVSELCSRNNIDTSTFLTVANFVSGKDYNPSAINLKTVIDYLKRTHTYILDYILPTIRRKLIEGMNNSGSTDVAFLILKFYDEYMAEVRHHMEDENTRIFSYVETLLTGVVDSDYSISQYLDGHDAMSEKLHELKDIILRHLNVQTSDILSSAIFDIMNCEEDLLSHCQIENRLLVPAVQRLENSVMTTGEGVSRAEDATAGEADECEQLSPRESEIVRCVATGLSNKEIAEKLYLSVHTVTTHRRNISAKLDIHSSAGLTIYALIHGLISLNEVKPS